MSSTRKAKDDSVLNQARYASSVDFERGLIANLVAKRCALLDDRADRELIWFVQYLSHQPGGLAAVVATLLASFGDRVGTVTMAKSRKAIFNAEEVKQIRLEFPMEMRGQFPLKGETRQDLESMSGNDLLHWTRMQLTDFCDREKEREEEKTQAARHPVSYGREVFLPHCIGPATNELGRELSRFCLDPAFEISNGSPWYFADLLNVLREYHHQWILEKSNVVVTALGHKLADNLNYTLQSRGLTLMEGNARLGKSHAAKSWCQCNPGKSRYVEVPPFNDDAGFFRALARGLGLGNFLNYKPSQIRERIESVLLTGDLLLVLDEAHRLWPLNDLRRGHPARIVWVMTMANAGVPICCVATPQFIAAQKALEKSGWNSTQLTGRIAHYEFLPEELSDADLIAVARTVLPSATDTVLKALAAYARTSKRYLSAVDTIAKRANYLAAKAGRTECLTEDVRAAMRESVLPSDERLKQALNQTSKPARLRRSDLPDASQPEPVENHRGAERTLEMTAVPRSTSLEVVES